ncbi:Hydroxyproline O-galactosyltransferase HPGT1 [Stylosanthes scabra]|uniref:Hexosyltransferase n=1 Tax=Stylosanthes scabra TaxID=79078 RepID=A0ABU6VQ05_9FABA|nr:Hydroxyproline O-galactosyltransferase HPGT1 [Stylosanthes scabra]
MQSSSRGSSQRLSSMAYPSFRIPTLLISMFATFASFYVAGRLWQDSQNRVYLIKQLDRITGQGQSAISVEDTLKIITCREQHKKLDSLEMELTAARQEGFVSKRLLEINGTYSEGRPLVMIGILTTFGRQKNRDAIRNAWMGSGAALKKLEDGKGIVPRFVIGRSENRGDNQDKDIDRENRLTNDFLILDDHVESKEGLPNKAKLFFAYAADKWDAEFFAKVNDDVYVNIDALGSTLATHLDKPRVYMGCMKSGEVFSEPKNRWYEPEWWKFGDKKSYFRHASGEMYVISRALAKFVSINRFVLRTYAHDDVSAGSWFIGLDVNHVDESKFCCSSWSTGAICAGV